MAEAPKQDQALLTRSPEKVAELLKKGYIAAITFGPAIYALFVEMKYAEILADFKGREKLKPFTLTAHPDHIPEIFSHPENLGLDPATSTPQLEAMQKILSSADRSVGVLFEIDDPDQLPERLVGHHLISINGESIPNTVSLMVSGPDENFKSIAEKTATKILTGTSANFSAHDTNAKGEDRDNGSGHNKLIGVLKDFANKENVVIHIPQEPDEDQRRGPSSPTYFVRRDGSVYTLRCGPITPEESKETIENLGLTYMGFVDRPKHIKPYDYSDYEYAGVTVDEEAAKVAYIYAKEVTANGDIHWNDTWKSQLAQTLALSYREQYTLYTDPT